ncbi:MAG: hypothetical protein WC627_11140 [Legionella sp.]|jgi:hypothetical protein
MPKYVLFNTINNDGIGDFTHMEDILMALRGNPQYSDVEFLLIVCFVERESRSGYDHIHNKLKALGVPFYFGNKEDHHRFSTDKALQNSLSTADQAIIISFDDIYVLYDQYIRPEVPLKFIGDHERCGTPDFIFPILQNGRDWGATYKSRHLGLSKKNQGIKIKPNPYASTDKAWSIIQEHDPQFITELLASSHSSDLKNFEDKHYIMPAYYNLKNGFYAFLRIIAISEYLSKDKDIVIYHSGFNLSNDDSFANDIQTIFKNSAFGQIEIISQGDSSMLVHANQQSSKTLRILTGFYVKDLSYNALYRLAKFVGASGDNTFEHCISMDVLPFYCSTNTIFKLQTLISLQEITQLQKLSLSAEERTAYRYFFDKNGYIIFNEDIDTLIKNIDERFSKVDFSKLITSWPKVTAYLKEHKNFYQRLEAIILEGLPNNALPAHFANKATSLQEQIKHTFLGNTSQQIPSSDSNININQNSNPK